VGLSCCIVHQPSASSDLLPYWVQGATLAFKIRSTGSPAYLLPAVSNYIPIRHLRSSSRLLFQGCCLNRNATTFVRLSGIVCLSKFAFLRLQDNFEAIHTHYFRLAFNYWSRDCPFSRFDRLTSTYGVSAKTFNNHNKLCRSGYCARFSSLHAVIHSAGYLLLVAL